MNQTAAGREQRLRGRLESHFAPKLLVIEDESHLHAGHAGAAGGHSHFRITIVAEAFRGVPPLGRHRLVYAATWDRALVKSITDAARFAGIDPIAVELKSTCIARAVANPACVVLDLDSSPAEIVLIDGHVPQVWHTFRLDVAVGDDVGPALVGPLRTVLRFYERRRDTEFEPDAPIYIGGEQVLSVRATKVLNQQLQHPVLSLPLPARVPQEVRYTTYLACLGLLMRRAA